MKRLMKKYIKKFQKFMNEGMDAGAKEYGEWNFLNRDNKKLFTDIQEECRDIANYAFMLYTKVEKLKENVKE